MIGRRLVRAAISAYPFKDKILFHSKPDFYDNPRIIFERMVERGVCDESCVWVVETADGLRRVEEKGFRAVPAYDKRRLLMALLSCSDYVTSLTKPPWWKGFGQRAIFVDHGLPVGKTVGAFLHEMRVKFDYIISPSDFFRLVYSALYSVHPNRILITGSPREDVIYKSNKIKSKDIIYRLTGRDPGDYSSTILYVPTFRDHDPSFFRSAVEVLASDRDFRGMLERENLLLMLKPHFLGGGHGPVADSGHMAVLDVNRMVAEGVTIYDFLRGVDVMITDYSSSWAEFLLLDRPIVFFLPDLEEYRARRGLIYEPYTEWVPGPVAADAKSLASALLRAMEEPGEHSTRRRWMRALFFRYFDGKATDRIIDLFWG